MARFRARRVCARAGCSDAAYKNTFKNMFLFLNLILVPRLGLAKMRDTDLENYAHNIVNTLTGNPSFPGVQADLPAITTQIDRFEQAKANVRFGPAGAAALKNEERARLEMMLKNLAAKCVIEANGNEAVFRSSGFDLRRRSQPHNSLPVPMRFDVVSLSESGKVRVSFKRVPGAFNYELYAAKPGEDFRLHTTLTNGRRSVVNNLDSLTIYRFRLRAMGKNGIHSEFTEVIEVPVL